MHRTRIVAACGLILALGAGLQRAGAVDPQVKAEAPPSPPAVQSLVFSPDGKILVACAGMKDRPGTVMAWFTETQKLLWRKDNRTGFSSASFSLDGKSIAVAHGKLTALRLDAATGRELGEVGPHPVKVRAALHIPDTELLATGSDGTIRLWDLKTGKVAKELKGGHPAEVSALVVSPNGKWLVSTGPDTSRIWDVVAGAELKDVIKQSQGIGYYGIAFVGPDRVLMSNNGAIQRITELPSGKEALRFKNSGGYAGSAYSPAAGLAAYRWSGTSEAHIAELTFRAPTADESARIKRLLKEFDDDSYEVRIAASNAMREVGSVAEPALRGAMTGGPSAEVRMRARETRNAILDEPLRKLTGHTGAIGPMTFSPDGKVLATGAADGTVRLWDPLTGKELARMEVAEVPAGKPGP